MTEHHEVGAYQPYAEHADYKTFHDKQDAYVHDQYVPHSKYYTDVKAEMEHEQFPGYYATHDQYYH